MQPQSKSPLADKGGVVSGGDQALGAPGTAPRLVLLTTGDMARRSSNTVRTVRFYEEVGVLESAERTEGGHRSCGDCEAMPRSTPRTLRVLWQLARGEATEPDEA